MRAVAKVEETGDHAAGQGRAVLLARDGNGDRLVRRGRNHVALPAADERNVSLGVGRRLSVSAIDDLIDEDARGLCEINGLCQGEGRDVLDLAARIAWRQGEILDDRVVWISRIHLAVDPSTNQLEGSRGTGRFFAVYRVARGDLQSDDLRRQGRRPEKRRNYRRSARPHGQMAPVIDATMVMTTVVPSAHLKTYR